MSSTVVAAATNDATRCDGSGSTNQLGGSFTNGKPLSIGQRFRILAMSLNGYRPCDISRRLLISHGCVSKILTKFAKTGSILPGTIGGSKPRVSTPAVIRKIYQFKVENYSLYAWEIREKLLRENICTRATLPSISSINRILRHTYRKTGTAMATTTTTTTPDARKQNNKHSQPEMVPTAKQHLQVGQISTTTMGPGGHRNSAVLHLPGQSNRVCRSMANLCGQYLSPPTSTAGVAGVAGLSRPARVSSPPPPTITTTTTSRSGGCNPPPASFPPFTTGISRSSNPQSFMGHNDKTVNSTKSMFTLYDTLNPFQGFPASAALPPPPPAVKTVQAASASATASTSKAHVSTYHQPEVIINRWASFQQHNVQGTAAAAVDGDKECDHRRLDEQHHPHRLGGGGGKRKFKTFLIEDILC